MKVVILAGGYGTRISEESHLKPKPMIEIGEKPILWHIMKIYSHYGYNDFIICCGYKHYVIKEWFADYYLHNSDIMFDFTADNKLTVLNTSAVEPWKVTLVDTGLNTMTGGRVKRIQKYVGNEPFMLTYGDGVANINIANLVKFHQNHGKIATITTVNVGQRFGVIEMDDTDTIKAFREKSDSDGSVINGGFMVFQPEIFQYIDDDTTVFERKPLESMAKLGELKAYKHDGFWHCMDTQRDKMHLEELWASNKAPWKIWNN
ncbi:MAG: glucose-1-phosphate cytidylyltransferase [Bacteroidales bacterium]|nr:glucose-1-phosphate cytidylyltransferase [Bacteroidales bacterium]